MHDTTPTPSLNQTREDQARREVGETAIDGLSAWVACAGFALLVASGVLFEWVDGEPGSIPFGVLVSGGIPDECAIEDFERSAENGAALVRRLREPIQAALARLGRGNAVVANLGPGGLALAAERKHLTGPDFMAVAVRTASEQAPGACDEPVVADPVGAIIDLHRQLGARGIHLVVVPTPGKLSAEPERIGVTAPLRSAGRSDFDRALADAGVDVFDPLPTLRALRQSSGRAVYLERDSHWRPEAVDAVAAELAAHLRPTLGGVGDAPRRREPVSVRNVGDLAALLGFRSGAEAVELAAVSPSDGAAAEVLLLGDSYAAIYSNRAAFERVFDPSLHWGERAGLADQLAFHLRAPVRQITRNAGGASASRRALAAEQIRSRARGAPGPLDGIRVVVLQFAARELSQGSWEPVAIPASAEGTTSATEPDVAPEPELVIRVRGRIAARSALPTPGATPYPDALFAVHLTGVKGVAGSESPEEIVVYLLGMRNQYLTPAARLPVGLEIDVALAPWESPGIQARFAPVFRTDLDDLSLLTLPTFYGRVLP